MLKTIIFTPTPAYSVYARVKGTRHSYFILSYAMLVMARRLGFDRYERSEWLVSTAKKKGFAYLPDVRYLFCEDGLRQVFGRLPVRLYFKKVR